MRNAEGEEGQEKRRRQCCKEQGGTTRQEKSKRVKMNRISSGRYDDYSASNFFGSEIRSLFSQAGKVRGGRLL